VSNIFSLPCISVFVRGSVILSGNIAFIRSALDLTEARSHGEDSPPKFWAMATVWPEFDSIHVVRHPCGRTPIGHQSIRAMRGRCVRHLFISVHLRVRPWLCDSVREYRLHSLRIGSHGGTEPRRRLTPKVLGHGNSLTRIRFDPGCPTPLRKDSNGPPVGPLQIRTLCPTPFSVRPEHDQPDGACPTSPNNWHMATVRPEFDSIQVVRHRRGRTPIGQQSDRAKSGRCVRHL